MSNIVEESTYIPKLKVCLFCNVYTYEGERNNLVGNVKDI